MESLSPEQPEWREAGDGVLPCSSDVHGIAGRAAKRWRGRRSAVAALLLVLLCVIDSIPWRTFCGNGFKMIQVVGAEELHGRRVCAECGTLAILVRFAALPPLSNFFSLHIYIQCTMIFPVTFYCNFRFLQMQFAQANN